MTSMNIVNLLFLLVGYVQAAEICYEPCGCWTDDFPFDDRPLPGIPGAGNNLAYELYTTEAPNTAIPITWDNIPAEFNPNRRTVFFFHGWNGGISTSYSTKNVLFDADHDINFISVDWSDGAGEILYPQAASNARVSGTCTHYLASQLVARGASLGNMHCMGYSLGGHACGYMGRSGGSRLARITGLDPAGPWFDFLDPEINVDKSDAQFVDIIHTNGGSLGIGQSTGHVDFYPNNGMTQPGCLTDGCSHGRAVNLNVASISYPVFCQFSAKSCANAEDADAGLCENCGIAGCNRLGFYATPSPGGRMYLRTTSSSPFCED